MNRDKISRIRGPSRRNNARSGNTKNNKEQDSEHSFDNESPDHPKSIASTPSKRERTISSSSVRSNRRQSNKSNTYDDSENEEGRDSTCSNHESAGSNDQKIKIINTVRKVEDFLKSAKNNENHEIESPDCDESSRIREKRRKSKKKRKNKNRSLDSNRIEDNDDEAHDEDRRSSGRDMSRTRRKKSHENVSRKVRRKRHRSQGDSSGRNVSQEKELPITEILRKAQENPKTRCEEPALPMAELTTDRIYVQGRNGFSAVKIPNDRGNGIFHRRFSMRKNGSSLYPIKAAIVAQKIWNSAGLIHQGLLAGMALMHFILLQTFFRPSLEFIEDYSVISEYYTNVFSYLVAICVISAFDRFDLARLNIEHFREIYVEHSRSFLAIPLYIATFCLHQTSLFVNENISLFAYPTNTTGIENNSTGIILEEDLTIWRKVTLAKDGLAVLAWFFVALGPPEDMFLVHLKSMEKYVEILENSG